MTQTITALDVARKALELADANPGFIYQRPVAGEGCKYVHYRDSDAPEGGCIFGQALLALGVKVDDIPENIGIRALLPELGIEGGMYGELAHSMGYAQGRQDGGATWRAATSDLRSVVAMLDREALEALTLEKIAKRMVELAEERPEHVYVRPDGSTNGPCYYVHDVTEKNAGGCIVGQALVSLGVNPARIEGDGHGTSSCLLANDIDGLKLVEKVGDDPFEGPQYSPEDHCLLDAIRKAQGDQDYGVPWGQAVSHVVRALAEVGK